MAMQGHILGRERRVLNADTQARRAERGRDTKGRATIHDFTVGSSAPPVQLLAFDHAIGDLQYAVALANHEIYGDPAPASHAAPDAHATAARGTAGGGGPLPHLATIQERFGRHDVSGVRAHVGGAAAAACDDLGAHAYASGGAIAFGRSPDLHTAAHEAAHVVQQSAGVSLAGGVGQRGDRYERHADAVADAVVAGKSAEPILDQMAGGGRAGSATKPGASADDALQKLDLRWTAPTPKVPIAKWGSYFSDQRVGHELSWNMPSKVVPLPICAGMLGVRFAPSLRLFGGFDPKTNKLIDARLEYALKGGLRIGMPGLLEQSGVDFMLVGRSISNFGIHGQTLHFDSAIKLSATLEAGAKFFDLIEFSSTILESPAFEVAKLSVDVEAGQSPQIHFDFNPALKGFLADAWRFLSRPEFRRARPPGAPSLLSLGPGGFKRIPREADDAKPTSDDDEHRMPTAAEQNAWYLENAKKALRGLGFDI